MTKYTTVFAILALLSCLFATAPRGAAEITAGHIDAFEQGTTLGWERGRQNPHAPRLVADGGPEGAGDAFLRLSSSGTSGPGSKLVMFNQGETWAGDYLEAGIAAIEVDLNNLGTTPVTMRFMLEGSGGKVFTDGFALPAASGWQHTSFSLNPDDLFSNGDIASTLGAVTTLWFLHNDLPSHPSPAVAADIGIANLVAIGMPIAPALLGDYNGSGLVEQADLDLVLLHWGIAAEPPPGAWTNDFPEGQIDQDELDGVLLNWGNTAEQSNAASVPEPGPWALLISCGVLMIRRQSWSQTLRIPQHPLGLADEGYKPVRETYHETPRPAPQVRSRH